jgi:HEAT repeat protein
MLADGLEALKKYDWGTDQNSLDPIEEATVASHADATVREDLENRLIAALKGGLSRDAHDYVCRKLAIMGTAASVPTLAALLGNKATGHMARYALERMAAPEAGKALRNALPTLSGNLKVGVISSLGSRRDGEAVVLLGNSLHDDDAAVARAAALALGAIGNADAVTVLQISLKAGGDNKQSAIDALLHCAESLLASGKPSDAAAIYQSLSSDSQGRLVRLAATRGMLACAAVQG